jgi:hypothetical protein
VNEHEMSRLSHDPQRLRTLATALMKSSKELSASAQKFLMRLSAYTGNPSLTGREKEWLWDLMASKTRSFTTRDGRGPEIIRSVSAWHTDIPDSEDEQEFLSLHERWQNSGLTEREWKLVFQFARQIGLLRSGEWVT